MVKLDVGDIAPDFTLPSTDGDIRLSEALGKADKGVIIYFYPKAMTPGCTTEACDFRDSLNSLKGAGYSVVGVSPDSLGSLEKFARRDALNFPLASDPERDVMEAYGAFGDRRSSWARTARFSSPIATSRPRGMWRACARNWGSTSRFSGDGRRRRNGWAACVAAPEAAGVCDAFAAQSRRRRKRRWRCAGRPAPRTAMAGGPASR